MARLSERTAVQRTAAPLEATAVAAMRASGPAQPPRLLVVGGPRAGAVIPLGADEMTVGRGWDNDVVLPDISVSRRHALLRRHGAGYLLLDLGSGNGTRINGRTVDKARLRDGDELVFGDSILQFVQAGGAAVRRTGVAGPVRGSPRWLRKLYTSRGAAYGAMATLLVAALAVGTWRWQERERVAREQSERDARVRATARQRFAEGASLLDEGRWEEAAAKLKVAAELAPRRPQVGALLERAAAEASRARALGEARAALARVDYAAAKLRLAEVSGDSALAAEAEEIAAQLGRALEDAVRGARARARAGDAAGALELLDPVLAADPARADALELKASISVVAARASPARPTRRGPSAVPGIVEAYLRGDLAGALDRARNSREPAASDMLARLDRFGSAWREGLARMEEDRPAEAIAALEQAENADRGLRLGRDGPLGREVRTALSRLHTRMAQGLRGEGDLASAAAHLRSAVARDPANEAARAQLRQLATRAEEAYLRGYMVKEADAGAARQAFQMVVAALPATDETAVKARRWLDRMDGKAAGEDEAPPAGLR